MDKQYHETGITVFHSVAEAIRNGWELYDHLPDGTWLVRKKLNDKWNFAKVEMIDNNP